MQCMHHMRTMQLPTIVCCAQEWQPEELHQAVTKRMEFVDKATRATSYARRTKKPSAPEQPRSASAAGSAQPALAATRTSQPGALQSASGEAPGKGEVAAVSQRDGAAQDGAVDDGREGAEKGQATVGVLVPSVLEKIRRVLGKRKGVALLVALAS